VVKKKQRASSGSTVGDSFGDQRQRQARDRNSQKAVGSTNRQRLRWLIRFANTDIQNPRRSPEELENLDWEIGHFIKAADSYRGMTYLAQSELALVHLRNLVSYGLHKVAEIPLRRGPKDPPAAINIDPLSGWDPNALDDGNKRPMDDLVRTVQRGSSAYFGPRRAVFLAAVVDLISSEEGKRIHECTAKDCTTIFYRWKRGLYCSKQCSQRARVQRHRANLGEVK
jgi:hypothetical protein